MMGVFLVALFAIFAPHSLYSQELFSHIKIDQQHGLSNDKVTAIAKDRDGIYWIGTRKGLNYIINGRVVQYIDQSLFVNKEIKFIYKDSESQMWVATSDALYLYDYDTNKFRVSETAGDYSSANSIGSVGDGVIICRRNVVEIYDHETQSVRSIVMQGNESVEFNAMSVVDDNRVILFCSQNRDIYSLNIATGEFDLYENISLPARDTNYRDKLFVDSKGQLWVSIYNNFLACYSLEGEGELLEIFSSARGNLSHNLILDIVEYKGEIIVATDGGGLNSIDIESFESLRSMRYLEYYDYRYTKSIYRIFVDPADGFFFGTIRDGLVTVRKSYIQSFCNDNSRTLEYPAERFSNAILSFCESSGLIWIGTDGDGVWVKNLLDHTIRLVKSTANMKVTDITRIDNQWLLLAVYGRGVYRLNQHSGVLEEVTIVSESINRNIIDKDMVVTLSQRSGDKIIIAADKLYEYDVKRRRIYNLQSNILFDSSNIFLSDEDDTNIYAHSLYSVYAIRKSDRFVTTIYSINAGDIIAVRKIGNKLWLNRNHSLYSYNLDSHTENIFAEEYSTKVMSIERGG